MHRYLHCKFRQEVRLGFWGWIDVPSDISRAIQSGRSRLGVSDLEGRRTAKTRQRLRKTYTNMRRPLAVIITTASAAPDEHSNTSTVQSRLKHLISRAEVCTDRLGARVCLRLPLAAG
jgi:hypothetical protein